MTHIVFLKGTIEIFLMQQAIKCNDDEEVDCFLSDNNVENFRIASCYHLQANG